MDITLTEEQTNALLAHLNGIYAIIGYAQGKAQSYDARKDLIKLIHFEDFKQKAQLNIDNGDLGEKIDLKKPIMEAIQDMIIELKLSGSLRQRKDGLFEFRHQIFGSTYGRSEEEIREKLLIKIQAEKSYLAKARKKKKQKPALPKTPLFSEFYETEYLPYKQKSRKRLAKSTVSGYETNVKFLKKSNYDKPLAEYNSLEIEDFLYKIPQTRKRQIMQGFMNNVFCRAVVKRIITINPCEAIEAMQHNTQEGTALEFIEQRAFFGTLFGHKKLKILYKYYLIFVYLTGCRRNEALYLLHDDVDFERKMIHISGTKTDGSDRYIPLLPIVEKLLKKINPVRDRFFNMSCNKADDIFRECIENHKLHDLRHSFGTIQYYCNDIDIKTLSLWLGHSNISTTLDVYTHPEQLDRAVFLRGDLSPKEKKAIMKAQYDDIIDMITKFLE